MNKKLKNLSYLLLAAGVALPLVLSPMKPPSKAPSGGPSAEAQTLTASAPGMAGTRPLVSERLPLTRFLARL